MTDTIPLKDSFSIFIKELSLTYIGQVYEKFDQLDSALIYLIKAREMDSIYLGSKTGFTTLHLANVYMKKNNTALALKYYREVMIISKIQNFQKDLMDVYNGIAKTFNKNGQPDSAIFYVNQTLMLGKSTTYPLAILDAVTLLSNIYKSKNKLDSTVKYMELSVLIKDSLFNREKIREVQNVSFNEQLSQQEVQKERELFRNTLKIYALIATVVIFLLITFFLLRNNLYKQKAYTLLQKQKQEIDNQKAIADETLMSLRSTQSQLIQSEKMASLGELTAGIAHEIQNPLNFVNNFSEVNSELLNEMKAEIEKGNLRIAKSIADDVIENQEKINHHGNRAQNIVKGMLQHSSKSTGIKELTDINALADEYLRLSYHGLRAKDKDFNATIKTEFEEGIGKINIIPQDIGRVLLNLYNNAFYAINEKRKQGKTNYQSTVTISTKKTGDKVVIEVSDNGNGIPQEIIDKIFQPFFTTKPTGLGTGLGLSLSYDIIQAQGGELKVESKKGEYAKFTVIL